MADQLYIKRLILPLLVLLVAVFLSFFQSVDAFSSNRNKVISVSGRLEKGVECMIVRSKNGMVYSLSGLRKEMVKEVKPGMAVKLTGVAVRFSTCQQGKNINVISIERDN